MIDPMKCVCGINVWLWAYPHDLFERHVYLNGIVPKVEFSVMGRIVSFGNQTHVAADCDFAILIESHQRMIFRKASELWLTKEEADKTKEDLKEICK